MKKVSINRIEIYKFNRINIAVSLSVKMLSDTLMVASIISRIPVFRMFFHVALSCLDRQKTSQ